MTLYQIQKSIAEKIKELPLIKDHGIGVAFTDAGSIVQEVQNAVIETEGIYVNVQSPRWTKESDASFAPVGNAMITVAVSEKPDLNRARHDDYVVGVELAEYLARQLNLQTIEGILLCLDGSLEAILDPSAQITTALLQFRFKYQISGELK